MTQQSEPTVRERRKGSDTRAEIRDVALELFTEQGYEATSMREIAERLGISKAALYYHFKSKESIVGGFFDSYLEAIEGVLERAESQPPSPERSAALVSEWLSAVADPGLRLIRFAAMNHAALRDTGTVDRERLMGLLDRAADLVVGPHAPVRSLLRVRMAFLSIQNAAIAAKNIDVGDEEILDAAREVAAMLTDGLAPPPADS
ncbi:TetR/AcrR family transcriptional regulator [Glycomyces arizonensis]|uniref:TetR/AcrR family transcriptional regulator n=1 Tax=Glycomyces arizonensis TaxID=256035 RepID=UPI000419DF00|nr:TetR/AcrR family transcriptional regulator [Glycomyces arizonensis]